MALSTLLKTVNVTPLSAPLDTGSQAADGAPTHGSPTGDAAVVQAHNALLMQAENCALTAAGTAQATTTSKVKTTATCAYLLNGVFKSKAATDNLWTLTGSAVTAGGSGATLHYALCLDGSGTASVIAGPVNQGSTTVWSAAPVSFMVADVAIVATLKISLTAATVFTPGTTATNAAGVTSTFEDGMDATLWGAYLITATRI